MKKWGFAAAAILLFSLCFGACTVGAANPSRNVHRIGGASRYDTASAIAQAAFPAGAMEAVLVSGANFPDALSAAGYAGKKDCPILITAPGALSAQTKNLIRKWGVQKMTIIGGIPSVGTAVVTTLENECSIPAQNIVRLFGKTRRETAEQVEAAGGFDKAGACVIASGAKAADALSISPWCYKNGWPIFLADGSGNLDQASLAAAKTYAKVYVLGSESSVSASVLAAIPGAQRITGNNRYDTSVNIAKEFSGSYQNTVFASGKDTHFPDPLVGSMLAGKKGTPILLADGTTGAEFDLIDSAFSGVTDVYVLGSTSSVTKATAARIRGTLFAGVYTIAAGKTNTVDLNKDGNTDKISYTKTMNGSFQLKSVTLNVNGMKTTAVTNEDSVGCTVYAADINIGDDYKNIIIRTDGIDSVNSVLLYAYNKSSVKFVKSWGISKVDAIGATIVQKKIDGSGAFAFIVVDSWSVHNVPLTLLNMIDVENLRARTTATAGGTASTSGSVYDFKTGFSFKTIGSITCYANSSCTKRAASIPKGLTAHVTGYLTDASFPYNLRVSAGGRTVWVKTFDLNDKNVEGFSMYA